MKLRKFILVCVLTLLAGCATRSTICQNLALGMTKQDVLVQAGKPYSKSCRKDADGNIIEVWSYNETTWDDGGWTDDRTIVTTRIVFENDEVKSFENAGERAVAGRDNTLLIL